MVHMQATRELKSLCEQDDMFACKIVNRRDKPCERGDLIECSYFSPRRDVEPNASPSLKAACERKDWARCIPGVLSSIQQHPRFGGYERLSEIFALTQQACGSTGNPWLPDDHKSAQILVHYCRRLSEIYTSASMAPWGWETLIAMDRQVDAYPCHGDCAKQSLHTKTQGTRGASPPPYQLLNYMIYAHKACQLGDNAGCTRLTELSERFPAVYMLIFPEQAAAMTQILEHDAQECLGKRDPELCQVVAAQYATPDDGERRWPYYPTLMLPYREEVLSLNCELGKAWSCSQLLSDYSTYPTMRFDLSRARQLAALNGSHIPDNSERLAKTCLLEQGDCKEVMEQILTGRATLSTQQMADVFGHECHRNKRALLPEAAHLTPSMQALKCSGRADSLPHSCHVELACQRYAQMCEDPALKCPDKDD